MRRSFWAAALAVEVTGATAAGFPPIRTGALGRMSAAVGTRAGDTGLRYGLKEAAAAAAAAAAALALVAKFGVTEMKGCRNELEAETNRGTKVRWQNGLIECANKSLNPDVSRCI